MIIETFTALLQHIVNKVDGYAMLIGLFFVGFTYIIWLANRSGTLSWVDLITSKGTNRVSLTKFLQLVGGITATWIMVQLTLTNKLSYEMMLTYLTYVGAIEGWSKYVTAKRDIALSDTTSSTVTTNTTNITNTKAPPDLSAQ